MASSVRNWEKSRTWAIRVDRDGRVEDFGSWIFHPTNDYFDGKKNLLPLIDEPHFIAFCKASVGSESFAPFTIWMAWEKGKEEA